MRINTLIILLLTILGNLQAQIIERQVLATGGDYWEVNSIQLSQTIGEW
jgi:hypothetical protein